MSRLTRVNSAIRVIRLSSAVMATSPDGCCRLFGFNLDLCPVLDISFDDEADNSLRGRCYGRIGAEVIANAQHFNAALRATGVLSCGKHFPGYACATFDPHHELPGDRALTRRDGGQ